MNSISEKNIKRSRVMYLFEAAFEYLISILVSGSFLATLTKELGMSDSLTGILSSIISLGCLFQLISLAIRKTSVKRLVVVFSILNQLLFMFLYVIPLTGIGKNAKIILFVILIFSAYFIYYIAHPKKITWFMSLVDKNHRGSFTANKEIMSLVFGMVFSFAMGALVDRFKNAGEIRVAFILSAAVIFVLMTVHSLTMIFSVEKPSERPVALKFGQALNDLAKNKKVLHITMVFVLYYISTYISVPFYGAYQIGELGLNLKFISAIAICGSISRILISKFWGNYADKKSFARMLEKCFIVLAFSQLCIVFAVPFTGKVTFVLYYILHGIALGGINSALTNLIFEHISAEKASDALAVTQAFAGLAGFLATLAVSPLVSCIQKSGNSVFGIPLYAQQLVTVLALVFTVFAIIYTRCVFIQKESK